MNGLIELIVLCLFVFGVTIVFAGCFSILGRLYRNHWNRRILNRAEILLLFIGIIGICCFVYGFIEPYQLEVTHTQLQSKKLSKGSTIRCALISDLHCDGHPRAEAILMQAMREAHPDLILFTGDAVNNRGGLKLFRECMSEFSKIAPTFACDGNHDTRSALTPTERYGGTGAKLLNCSATVLPIKKNLVWVGGVSIDNETCMEHTLETSPPDSYRIFLYHFPEGIERAAAHKVDLFCGGHTHGGQIRLPLYGAVVTMAISGKKLEWGPYKVGETNGYITRGVGMTGIPVRFLCPPELTLIDIQGTGTD